MSTPNAQVPEATKERGERAGACSVPFGTLPLELIIPSAKALGYLQPEMRWPRAMTNKLAFITGIFGSLALVLLTVIGGANSPNYSHASQFISELGADGAPNAGRINFGGFLPAGIFLIAFALFAWRSLPRSGATTFGMFGLALFALGYLIAVVFPCEPGCRPTEPTVSQTIHNLFGLLGYLIAPPTLFALGWQARRWPNATPLSALGFTGAGFALLGLLFLSPEFRYVGVAQRILEGSVVAWIMACALYLARPRDA